MRVVVDNWKGNGWDFYSDSVLIKQAVTINDPFVESLVRRLKDRNQDVESYKAVLRNAMKELRNEQCD